MTRDARLTGRSTLLRAGLPPTERPRNRLLRYGAILSIMGVVAVLVLIARGELLSTSGPGWVLYLIHDALWLPLYGRYWTAIFPDALIWLVIVGGVLALVLVEFLGIASPLRLSQVALMRVLLPAFPGPVLVMHRALRSLRVRSGLAEQVLRDLRDEALHPFITGGSAPGSFERLCHLQKLQLAFGLQSPRDLVTVADILGLAAIEPEARYDASVSLRSAAAELKPEAITFWSDLMAPGTFKLDFPAVLKATMDLEAGASSPEALACRTVQVAVFLTTGGDSSALVWFDSWARIRAVDDGALSARLAEAEALCAFEHWAAMAETHASRGPVSVLLAEAFPGLHLLRPRGERAAQDAVLSGGAP